MELQLRLLQAASATLGLPIVLHAFVVYLSVQLFFAPTMLEMLISCVIQPLSEADSSDF